MSTVRSLPRLVLPAALLAICAFGGRFAVAAPLVSAGTYINTSPEFWPGLQIPGGYQSVDLSAPTEIACPSAAGCSVEIDIFGSAQDTSGQPNQIDFFCYVDSTQDVSFAYAGTQFLTNGDMTAASVGQTITVAKGNHSVLCQTYTIGTARLGRYQAVYRVFK